MSNEAVSQFPWRICQCDLSDEFHVVNNETCCEICRYDDEKSDLSKENIDKALTYINGRINDLLCLVYRLAPDQSKSAAEMIKEMKASRDK